MTTGLDTYAAWLAERGREFSSYADLWRWSVTDLDGSWTWVWEFFDVQGSYDRVIGSPDMPDAQWFPGAELNYAKHMLGLPEDADRTSVLTHSQTRGPVELTLR